MPASQGHDRGAIMEWLSHGEPDYVPAVDRGSVRYLGTGPNGGPLVSFHSTDDFHVLYPDYSHDEIELALAGNCEWWASDGIVGSPRAVNPDGLLGLGKWKEGDYRIRETRAYRAELFRHDEDEEDS